MQKVAIFNTFNFVVKKQNISITTDFMKKMSFIQSCLEFKKFIKIDTKKC